MKTYDYRVSCHFHAVGQGLFASGSLYGSSNDSNSFRWVYDCGTNSKQTLVSNEIAALKAETGGEKSPKINLVAISHFDRDHINGLALLLSEFRIGTLLLPYIPLWQRLLVAFEEGVDTQQDLMNFFLNPVAYVGRTAPQSIGRIVFVLASDGELPATQGVTPEAGEPEVLLELDDRNVRFGEEASANNLDSNDVADFQDSNMQVGFLRNGDNLPIGNIWEFVPYNDASLAPKADRVFVERVAKVRDQLLAATMNPARLKALKNLKDLYDTQFGKSPERRNVISLFLFGGVIARKARYRFSRMVVRCLKRHGTSYTRVIHTRSVDDGMCSLLYTGDGYMNTSARLDQLKDYLGAPRMDSLKVLQVMHHGARANWQPGLAGKLNSSISVFCSDPEHKGLGHPHAEVLRDFWGHGPVQVDKECGVTIWGDIRF